MREIKNLHYGDGPIAQEVRCVPARLAADEQAA